MKQNIKKANTKNFLYERKSIFFTEGKKEFPILKLEIKSGKSSNKANLGEILYEMTQIFQQKQSID